MGRTGDRKCEAVAKGRHLIVGTAAAVQRESVTATGTIRCKRGGRQTAPAPIYLEYGQADELCQQRRPQARPKAVNLSQALGSGLGPWWLCLHQKTFRTLKAARASLLLSTSSTCACNTPPGCGLQDCTMVHM